jgi:hypothetical protein
MHKPEMVKYFDGKICPYCDKETECVDSSVIYGKSYGLIWLCEPCKAFVGVHRGTHRALGRLADDTLRTWKKNAHACFDQLWQRKIKKGFTKQVARDKAYKWLSSEMKIPKEYTHIGMFDEEQCRKVIELCKPYLSK